MAIIQPFSKLFFSFWINEKNSTIYGDTKCYSILFSLWVSGTGDYRNNWPPGCLVWALGRTLSVSSFITHTRNAEDKKNQNKRNCWNFNKSPLYRHILDGPTMGWIHARGCGARYFFTNEHCVLPNADACLLSAWSHLARSVELFLIIFI
jgi:hypothetical protein